MEVVGSRVRSGASGSIKHEAAAFARRSLAIKLYRSVSSVTAAISRAKDFVVTVRLCVGVCIRYSHWERSPPADPRSRWRTPASSELRADGSSRQCAGVRIRSQSVVIVLRGRASPEAAMSPSSGLLFLRISFRLRLDRDSDQSQAPRVYCVAVRVAVQHEPNRVV